MAMHYCACYPRYKKDRIPTNLFCWVHRRFVCLNCVADESYSNSIIGPYEEWLRTPNFEYPPRCPLSNNKIDDDPRSSVRLTCLCLFDAEALKEYLIQQDTSNLKCPKCEKAVIPSEEVKKTQLGKAVSRFVKHVKRAKTFKQAEKVVSRNVPKASSRTAASHSTALQSRALSAEDRNIGISRRARPERVRPQATAGTVKLRPRSADASIPVEQQPLIKRKTKAKKKKKNNFTCRHAVLGLMGCAAIASALMVILFFWKGDHDLQSK